MTHGVNPGINPERDALIRQKVEAAYAKAHSLLGVREVVALFQELLREHDATLINPGILSEIEELNAIIRRTRNDVAMIRPKDINTDHIPLATDELDAVVTATEDATNKIMDVCDEISALAGAAPPELAGQLNACTTKIFEACNFQDITGQRIVKVVTALKHIDSKVDALLKTVGDGGEASAAPAPATEVDPDKALLNGPQMAKDAISQDDIDRLMAGF